MKNIPIRNIGATQKEANFSEEFSIQEVGKLLRKTDLVQKLHRHDFFYVLVLKKGAGRHEIDFISYKVCDNSLFFMRPGQVHQHTLKAGSLGYLMAFGTGFYTPFDKVSHQLLRKVSTINNYHLDVDSFKKIFFLLTRIFQEHTERQENYHEAIKANMALFFIELARQHNQGSTNNATPYQQERLEGFLELLEKHITSHKKVSFYADVLNLSLYQLNTITKATLGKTCSELINESIILEAKRHLLATSGQVNQIADRLGYGDASYFIRFFKKHTGYSPEIFRHNFK